MSIFIIPVIVFSELCRHSNKLNAQYGIKRAEVIKMVQGRMGVIL